LSEIYNQTQTVSAGYGFVDYYDHAHAVAAIQQLNGRNVYGSELKVNWAYASHKEDTSSTSFCFIYLSIHSKFKEIQSD
jgi:RNA recognition motif-containing protein